MTKTCRQCNSPMRHDSHDSLGAPIHVHVPTGETRTCSREGCERSWQVTCHNGHRKWCPLCARALRRGKDRDAKRAKRRQEVLDADYFTYELGVTFEEARRFQQEYQLSPGEMRSWLAYRAECRPDLEDELEDDDQELVGIAGI